MTQQSNERISALVDGEIGGQVPDAAVDVLLKGSEARECWARYHLMSDIIKRNQSGSIDQQLSSRVMAALEDEPTILAPPKQRSSGFGRHFSGLAVAASVAATAVFSAQFLYKGASLEDGQVPVNQVAQTSAQTSAKNQALAKVQNPAQMPTQRNFVRPDANANIQVVTQSQGASQAQSQRQFDPHAAIQKYVHPNFNKYIVDHNQQTARAVQGVVPYARIIAYPNKYYFISQSQK